MMVVKAADLRAWAAATKDGWDDQVFADPYLVLG
jgi:hypothetical protein